MRLGFGIGLAYPERRVERPAGSSVRTAPFWSGQCFCGHVTRFRGAQFGAFEPGCVLRHLVCEQCGALFFFRSEFKHTEPDGTPFYHFVQLDNPGTDLAVVDGRYR